MEPLSRSLLGGISLNDVAYMCRSHPCCLRWCSSSWQPCSCQCSGNDTSLCPSARATGAAERPCTSAAAHAKSWGAKSPGHHGGWHAAAAGPETVALHGPDSGCSHICSGSGNASCPARPNQDPGDSPGKHSSVCEDITTPIHICYHSTANKKHIYIKIPTAPVPPVWSSHHVE